MSEYQLTGLQQIRLRQILVDNLRGIDCRPSFDIGKIDYTINRDDISYRLNSIVAGFVEVLGAGNAPSKAAPEQSKTELIEQMRDVLKAALKADPCPALDYWQTVETYHHRGECWHAKAQAALSAAERGD